MQERKIKKKKKKKYNSTLRGIEPQGHMLSRKVDERLDLLRKYKYFIL
jgi:hypothetical protein